MYAITAEALSDRSAVHARPAKIRNENVLMAVMAIVAVYEPHQARWLNDGIGLRSVSFATS